MKRILTALLLLPFFFACNNETEASNQAENDLDAARMFISDALDGKWDEAKQFLLQDSTNIQLLETAQSKYQNLSREERQNYKQAEPIFYDSRKIGDSITIVNYANSYRKKKDSLKVVKTNGQWRIDLKYSLLPNPSNGK